MNKSLLLALALGAAAAQAQTATTTQTQTTQTQTQTQTTQTTTVTQIPAQRDVQPRPLAELRQVYQQALTQPGRNTGNPVWAALLAELDALVAQGQPAREALLLRAQAHTAVGWWSRAADAWAALERSGPLAEPERVAYAEVLRALAFAQQTNRSAPDLASAARNYARALELNPANDQARAQYAALLQETGRAAEAGRLWQEALQRNPGDARARYFVGVSARLAQYGPEVSAAFTQGYTAFETGDRAGAIAAYTRVTALAPDFADAWRNLARAAFESGDVALAARAYARLAELDGGAAETVYWLNLSREAQAFGLEAVQAFRRGYEAYVAGQREAALAQFVRAAELSPRYAKAHAWVGRVHFEAARYPQAAAAYARAAELEPGDAAVQHFLRLARSRSN